MLPRVLRTGRCRVEAVLSEGRAASDRTPQRRHVAFATEPPLHPQAEPLPATLTITQLPTHTSGLGEAGGPAAKAAKTLADLVPCILRTPHDGVACVLIVQRANFPNSDASEVRRAFQQAARKGAREIEFQSIPSETAVVGLQGFEPLDLLDLNEKLHLFQH